MPFSKYKHLMLKLRVFSAGQCCYGNLLCHENNTMCSPVIGQFFDTMIVASIGKEGL